MTRAIDDETLVAYVDGELDQDAAREVEAAIAADPALAETVRALREGAATLRAAFAEPVRAEVPERLIAAVNDGFAAQRPKDQGAPWHRRPIFTAMAASIAILVVGLGAVYGVVDWQVERRLARLEAAQEADRALIQSALVTALEKHLSGVPATWRNPQSGSSGRVEPVRTFRNAGGQWCREYILEAALRAGDARHEFRRAIACRNAEGRWTTKLETTNDS